MHCTLLIRQFDDWIYNFNVLRFSSVDAISSRVTAIKRGSSSNLMNDKYSTLRSKRSFKTDSVTYIGAETNLRKAGSDTGLIYFFDIRRNALGWNGFFWSYRWKCRVYRTLKPWLKTSQNEGISEFKNVEKESGNHSNIIPKNA